MEKSLLRSVPCPDCGAELLWTQNVWPPGSETSAAYRCLSGHVVDPSTTRQCPACGVHDTALLNDATGVQDFCCARCGTTFTFPRS
jgi:endogenous inhibitor of DNA gyrase (YacG/DUF329 family)